MVIKNRRQLLKKRFTAKALRRLSQAEIARLASLVDISQAEGHLEATSTRPERDKSRTARRVGPAKIRTAAELRARVRWYRNPNQLDLEGVDAPKGSRTQFPRQKKRKKPEETKKSRPVTPQISPLSESDIQVAKANVTLQALQTEANRFGREGNQVGFFGFLDKQPSTLSLEEKQSLTTAFEEGVNSQRQRLGSFSGEPAFQVEETPTTPELSDDKLLLALDIPALRGRERRQMLDKFGATSLRALERIQAKVRDKLAPEEQSELPKATASETARSVREGQRERETVSQLAREEVAAAAEPHIAEAKALGEAAFLSDAPSAPAQNREFMAFLADKAKGQDVGFSLPLLKAFSDAIQAGRDKAAEEAIQEMGGFEDLPSQQALTAEQRQEAAANLTQILSRRIEQQEEKARPEELATVESSPLTKGSDFILTNDDVFDIKSPARRFDANLDAIRLVKQLEQEDRLATPAEQSVLAKYAGFGDSAFEQAFARFTRDNAWKERGEQLRELVTPEEFTAIERSRQNAFYTTPEIIKSMWTALERMDARRLQHPRILEPSAGSGRFLGLQPVEMAARSERSAVELDDMTGQMLKHLYPNTEVYAGVGYQEAPIPNDSIDIAISNVPFLNIGVTDPEFGKGRKFLTRSLHNYFFAKTLDKLRPGGVLAFITTHHTLDAKSSRIREALAEQADFVGAIRLPKGAFPDTEVVTDIVYMRKRLPGDVPGDARWVNTGEITVKGTLDGRFSFETKHNVNQYFLDHPEMVLGEHSATGTQFRRDEYSVEAPQGQDLEAELAKATQRLPEDIITSPLDLPGREEVRGKSTPTAINAKEGSYVLAEGKLSVKKGRILVDADLSQDSVDKVQGMLLVRDAARVVLDAQLHDASPATVQDTQSSLNSVYDSFVKKHGRLNSKTNVQLMKLDPDGALLRALESPDGKDWTKMPIFSDRVIKGLGDPTATTPRDALAVTLNETGGLDFERMGELLGQGAEEVRDALAKEKAIYKNPVGGWEAADDYLTGNVRRKLEQAIVAAGANPALQTNVEALQAVQPEDLTPSQIDVQLGSPWVPSDDVNDFVAQLLGAFRPSNRRGAGRRPFYNYVEQTGQWTTELAIDGNRAKMTSEWGTQRMPASAIITSILNSKAIEVKDSIGEGKTERNAPETIAAQEKAVAIQEEFKRWIWDDPERAERLARQYNDTFNNMRPRVFDGAHQTFPGRDTKWASQLHRHQKDAIWRIVADGSTLLAHEVGFGKTAVMVAGGMELRRLGLARKPMFVVPKATHAQFRSQFQEIYPYAKVLFPEADDFTAEKRPEMMARIATGDWDAVIVADTQFRRLPVKPETEQALIRDELRDLEAAMEIEAEESGANSKTNKQLQKVKERLLQRMLASQQRSEEITDDTVFFEDLGVDQVFIDEADMYKNLRFVTRMSRIKGLPNTDSQRAWDMFQKVRYLQRQGNGRGVVFATGTPIANTIAEGYTMMRYLQQPMLEERGLQHFDAWARTFGGTTEGLEQTPTGAYRLTQRFAKFSNVPELSNIWQSTADIRVTSEVPEITKLQPRLVNKKGETAPRAVIAAPASEALKVYMGTLARRADNLKNVDPTVDNMLKIANDARMASLDMRLVDPGAEFDPEGKLAEATENIASIYSDTTADKGVQLVFLDMGTPKAIEKPKEEGPEQTDFETDAEEKLLKDVYGDLRKRLVSVGVPNDEIAFIHDAKTSKAKEILFAKVNKGAIRILLGSTGKMGVGVNVQQRAAALHHLDAPWRPRDIEQREGRIIRQGNIVYGPKIDPETKEVLDVGKGVQVYNYVTEGSFDAYMWQAIEAKAKAIKSLLRRNVVARSIEDVDSLTISASEAKALASGNPDVMKSVQLKNDISRLQLVQATHKDSVIRAQSEIRTLPLAIDRAKESISGYEKDIAMVAKNKGEFSITLNGKTFSERPEAGEAMEELLRKMKEGATQTLGTFQGFSLLGSRSFDGFRMVLHSPTTGQEYVRNFQEITALGSIQRIENITANLPTGLELIKKNLSNNESSLETFRAQAEKPFEQMGRLSQLQTDLTQVEKRLQGIEEEEKQESQSDGFFVARSSGGFQEVHDAETVIIPGFEQEFFVHREIDGKGFSVSEGSSGLSVGSGSTKSEAVEGAKDRVTNVGVERMASIIADKDKTPRKAREISEKDTDQTQEVQDLLTKAKIDMDIEPRRSAQQPPRQGLRPGRGARVQASEEGNAELSPSIVSG